MDVNKPTLNIISLPGRVDKSPTQHPTDFENDVLRVHARDVVTVKQLSGAKRNIA